MEQVSLDDDFFNESIDTLIREFLIAFLIMFGTLMLFLVILNFTQPLSSASQDIHVRRIPG